MEVIERLWQDGNIEATLQKVREILGREDGSTTNTDALLLFAYIYYQLRNVDYAAELLNKVTFDQFDLKQWIVENNVLVLKYLGNKNFEDKKTVAASFGTLLEKIGGLPFSDVQLLNLNVCFNYALVIFCSNSLRALVPGGYNVTGAILNKTLERVCSNPDESDEGFNQGIKDKLRAYFQEKRAILNGQEQKQEELLVASLVWLLASNLLINSQVTEAQSLIKIVSDTYNPTKLINKKMDLIFSLMVDTENFQDFLIPSCHLIECCASFILKNKMLSMKHCDLCLNLRPEFISGLFLKGLLLYESGKYEDAVPCLQKVVTLSSENGYKATALNVLGCICAKLGKPHTALLKFRQSFACHAGHLEALYNVAVVYHDNGDLDLEISLWKYMLKILSFPNAWNFPDTVEKMNMDYVCGIIAQALGDTISEDHFFISTDIHCMQRCDVKNSKLSLPSVLFKIAHNCLILKRYSEASEFYGQLFAQLNDKPVHLHECGILSLTAAYKEFAETLSKCGRYEDCLVVCEKILNHETGSNRLSKTMTSHDSAKFRERRTLIEIMLCKATVLKELHMPIEANECYERILDAINDNYKTKRCTVVESDVDEPKHKRLKLEMVEIFERNPHADFEELQKLKALTLNDQGMLLSSLGRTNEALLLLAQSISCQPDCLKYRYNHTRLLVNMRMEDRALADWLKFRKIDQTSTTKSENFKLKDLPRDDEDHDLYIEMDSHVLLRLSKRS